MLLLIMCIIIAVIGGIMLFDPDFFWNLTEGWKRGAPPVPSDTYVKVTRVTGVFLLVMGIGCTVWTWITM